VKPNVVVLGSSSGVAPAERREPERSEGDRSGAGATPDARAAAERPARPDPEVVVDAKRRTFTAEYKLRVLAAADAAVGHGGIGALLRREGLYSSHLVTWRRERQAGILKGLTPRARGPKPTRSPQDEEIRRLREANQRLTEELRKAEIVIDVQKKVAALLDAGKPSSGPKEPR
jgi:transposase-like protein